MPFWQVLLMIKLPKGDSQSWPILSDFCPPDLLCSPYARCEVRGFFMFRRMNEPGFVVFLLTATTLTIQMPMAFTLGGLAGIVVAPNSGLTTLPISLQLVGGLLVITPMSLLMGKHGRRAGFALAAIATILGGALGVAAIVLASFLLLCAAHMLLGASIATFALLRFAAAEIVVPERQAAAISFTLGTSLAAVLIAPRIFDASYGAFGPYTFAGAYAAVGIVAAAGLGFLTITPLAPPVALEASSKAKRPSLFTAVGLLPRITRERPRVAYAILAGAASYAAMMGLMTAAPVAMVECGLTEAAASNAISMHMIAMFAPSFFTGTLIARIGAPRVLGAGFVIFAAAAAVAATEIDLWGFRISLILSGVAWNFGYIGATAMLNAELDAEEKPLFQGINDTVVMLLSTTAALLAGPVLTGFGWAIAAIVTVPVALLLLTPTFLSRETHRGA